MTCLTLTDPAARTPMSVGMLRPTLTAQDLPVLTHAVIGALLLSGRDLCGNTDRLNPLHAVDRSDAADIEYASWMPDPGAIELASWAAHIRHPAR